MSETVSVTRWIAKKAARTACALGSAASGVLALRDRLRPAPVVRVLTYHRFGQATREPFRISRRAFEAQMRHLAESGLALSLADFEAFLRGELVPPAGASLVTIDDGSVSTHRVALPILRHYGIPAVLYAIAGAVGTERGPDGGAPEPFMSWQELQDLVDGGIAIGSHSVTHRSFGTLSDEEAIDEATRSKILLEEQLGIEVRSFAYPYGTRTDFDERSGAILAGAGYSTVFTSQHGAIRPGADPTVLPRVKVEGGEGMPMFRLILRGGMDAWGLVDRAASAIQTPGAR